MTTREFYESIGASYDNVLVRFGSEKMITKFAKRFADDTTFQDMCKALEEKNAKKLSVWHTPSKAFVAILALTNFTRRAMTLQRILGTVSCQAMSRIMKRSAKNIR